MIIIDTKKINLYDLKNNEKILDFFILSSLSTSYEKKVKNILHRIIRTLKLELDEKELVALSRIITIRLQEFIAQGIVAKNENGYFLVGEFNIKPIYTSSGITIK
jgi:hypothetical protein